MKPHKQTIILSLILCGVFAVALVALAATAPFLIDRLMTIRRFPAYLRILLLVAVYSCVPLGGIALWALTALLCNLRRDRLFCRENVRHLGWLCGCCAAVAAIMLVCGGWYLPFWVIAVFAAFMALILRIIQTIFVTGAALADENSLTI